MGSQPSPSLVSSTRNAGCSGEPCHSCRFNLHLSAQDRPHPIPRFWISHKLRTLGTGLPHTRFIVHRFKHSSLVKIFRVLPRFPQCSPHTTSLHRVSGNFSRNTLVIVKISPHSHSFAVSNPPSRDKRTSILMIHLAGFAHPRYADIDVSTPVIVTPHTHCAIHSPPLSRDFTSTLLIYFMDGSPSPSVVTPLINSRDRSLLSPPADSMYKECAVTSGMSNSR